jgi:hypothetical protein
MTLDLPPKILQVIPLKDYMLYVIFSNDEVRYYNVAQLFNKPHFQALQNVYLFKQVNIDQTGRAVIWNDELDLSEYEIYEHGTASLNNEFS